MLDESLPMRIRRQIPRVLKQIPNQRSVDVLLAAVGHQDLTLRAAVLKALNRLRETDGALNFDNHFVTEQFSAEARHYYELNAALAPFKDREAGGAHRGAPAGAIDRGTSQGNFGAALPAARTALSSQGDVFGISSRLAQPARGRHCRPGVPGQYAGARHQAHPAAAARAQRHGRAGGGGVHHPAAHQRRPGARPTRATGSSSTG